MERATSVIVDAKSCFGDKSSNDAFRTAVVYGIYGPKRPGEPVTASVVVGDSSGHGKLMAQTVDEAGGFGADFDVKSRSFRPSGLGGCDLVTMSISGDPETADAVACGEVVIGARYRDSGDYHTWAELRCIGIAVCHLALSLGINDLSGKHEVAPDVIREASERGLYTIEMDAALSCD